MTFFLKFMQKIIFYSIIILLFSACTLKTTYNYLDWMTANYLEDFVELNDKQQEKLEKSLADTLAWHRSRQLPLYIEWLESVRHDLKKGLSNATVDRHAAQILTFWMALMEYLSNDMATLLPSLNSEQRKELFINLANKNEEFQEEYIDITLQQRHSQLADRLQDNFENWLNTLTDEQVALIQAAVQKMENTAKGMLDTRIHWQDQLRKILENHQDKNGTREAMRKLFTQTKKLRSGHYQQQLDHNQKIVTGLIVDISKITTDEQKEYLFARIERFIQLFSELINDGKIQPSSK